MGYGTIVLEGLLGLFLLLTGCLVLRTMMLEAPRTFPESLETPIDARRREQMRMRTCVELLATDMKRLEACGLTAGEIAALLHLKKWYEAGEGERAVLLSRWEFIKQLVHDGRLEV